MPWCQISFFSEVLKKEVGMNVILPKTGRAPFPAYYLLHGLSDDHTGWMRRTRIEPYALEYPLVVVIPDGYRGFYTDNEEGPAYEKYLLEEVIGFVERTFPVQRRRSRRCIGGLSMGGYGALRLALANPELFASANSHSGATHVGTLRYNRAKEPERTQIFGTNPIGSRHDLWALARKAAGHGRLPKLQIDCGTEDSLLKYNRDFHAHLQKLKIAHEYAEYPGQHNWAYWDEHVRQALAFHARALGIKSTRDQDD
jgi:S-formylglutathione hydrolase FrmB